MSPTVLLRASPVLRGATALLLLLVPLLEYALPPAREYLLLAMSRIAVS